MSQNAQDYLLSIPLWTRKKNSLEAVGECLNAMGNPQDTFPVIHVAGTNGKGSVCADLTSILKTAGYRVGTFVSPHLIDIKERFLIQGKPVEEADFQEAFSCVKLIVDQMLEEGFLHPTFFEYMFYLGMELFSKKDLDYVIVETGLGGRLDTTNVIKHPIATVITSISLDHTQYLGDTIDKIATEKVGIIKKDCPIIFDANDIFAKTVIEEKAKEIGVSYYPLTNENRYIEIPFKAPYQSMNAALAVKAIEVLNIPNCSADVCKKGLETVAWQGRMEEVLPDVWLEGAHNPGGIKAFVETMSHMQQQEPKPLQLLFGAVVDKDYKQMIGMLCEYITFERVTIAHFESERSLEKDVLKQLFEQHGCKEVEAFHTTNEALERALSQKKDEDRLFVIGSLYLVGEVKQLIRRM